MKREKPDKGKAKRDAYTVTEVGTLLESMDGKIDAIAEGHTQLDQRMEKLEVAVHGNSRRLDILELRTGVVNDKATRLEDAVSKLSKDLRETREELKGEVTATREELKRGVRELGERLTVVEPRR